MELTTLATAFLIALGLLAADTFVHSDTVVVDVIASQSLARSDRMSLDPQGLALEFEDQLRHIASTDSLVQTPLIRTTQQEGVGQAVFSAINLRHAANALQAELGYEPDRIRLALYIEHGQLRGLITGTDRRVGQFRTVLTAGKDETLVEFVRRCAQWSTSKLAPYATALYLLKAHGEDKDFSELMAMIDDNMAKMPPTPINLDRSLFENLAGLVALFRDDPPGALEAFESAIIADPDNAPPILNAAFVDLQVGDFARAAGRMKQLAANGGSIKKPILCTVYVIWAAAAMGQRDFAGADALLATAVSINPDSPIAYDLWAETKQEMGDYAAAKTLHQRALANSGRFANFGEVAALYFRISWRPGLPVVRSPYVSPTLVQFH
jgi:tetratricopeptide (TPR) repeat protein